MEISSCIIYEDKQLLVCHKPCGLAVQSARMDTMDLESAVKNYLAEKNAAQVPYLAVIHRLDQPVEGLVILAKTPEAAAKLSRQITEGKMQKYYLSRIVASGTPNGKKARLSYRVLKEKDGRAIFEIRLFTGRHHQIRVQMAGHGMPLMGDRKYNNLECMQENGSLALCAYRIAFCHPVTGKKMELKIKPENPLLQ